MSYANNAVKAAVFFAPVASAMLPFPPNHYGNGEPNYPVMAAYGVVAFAVAVVACAVKCCCKRTETSENAQTFMPATNYGTDDQGRTSETPSPENV